MKKRDKKFISMVTAVALSFSMVLNYSPLNVKGADISEGELKDFLKEKINNYESNTLKNNMAGDNSLNENGDNEKDPEEEIRVIVQLKEAPAIDGDEGADYTSSVKADEENIKDSQEKVIEEAQKITGTQIRRSFGYLVNGFSISTKRKNIDKLNKIKGVKCVTEVRSYKTDMQYAKPITGVTNVWKDLGYKGEGMVVSIIDTGIDYNHKDLQNINTDSTKLKESDVNDNINKLGHGHYFSNKVPYGYNYADANENVIDTGSMHGMHVAGIVGANGDDEETANLKAVKGVAPEAQLLAMKVFTNNPGTSSAYDDDIIAAIEDSVKLGADVINMSLGSTAGFTNPDDPENQAVQKATDAGVICVISAGNEATSTQTNTSSQPKNQFGLKDTSTVGSPSTASTSLSVASMENTNMTYKYIEFKNDSGFSQKIQYLTPNMKYLHKLNGKYEIVDCGTGKEENFKNEDLTGKIALIQRGDLTFQKKYENAIAHNAAGVLIYNNEGTEEMISMAISNAHKPVLSLGLTNGEKIAEEIKKGNKEFTLDLSAPSGANDNIDAGDMSQYTSWGATSDLEFKPEITAPGGDIFSLANNNSYQSMSGTSMAAPDTAGSEALIIQSVKKKYPNLSGSDLVSFVKNTAMNTAKPMFDKHNSTSQIPYSPRRQGAGLIQVEEAVNNNVIIKYKDGKGAAALKEVGNSTSFELEITNYGDKAVTYNLNNEKVYGESVDSDKFIHEEVLNGSSAEFDKKSVTVQAGETAKVNVTLKISDKEEKDRFVEGYLNFTSTDAEVPSLSVPFMGFYGDWSKESVVDTPNYEGSSSKAKSSGLVNKEHNLYGAYLKDGEEYIDKAKSAFSPNGDDFKDEAIPALYFLRNAKEVKIEVLDSEGNVVRELYNDVNLRKNVLEDLGEPTYLNAASWDGTIYDTSTGKYVKAEDGEYSVRVKSKVDFENAKEQVLDIPVKIDTKAPEVKIKGVEKYQDADKKDAYKLSWEAKDNEGGSQIEPQFAAFVNGETIDIDSSKVTEVDGVYSTDIPFADGEVNDVSVTVSDYAGNMTVAESKVKAEKLNTIAISGLSDDVLFVGEKDLKDGKFVVKGSAGDDLVKLQINGQDVEVKDNCFEKAVDLKDGENVIKVYAEDKDGKSVVNKEYKVFLDRINPEVEVDNMPEKFTTENKELTFNINVKDDTKCTAVLVNQLVGEDLEPSESEMTFSGNKGTGKIELADGLNKVELKVTDKAGNTTTKTYLVTKGDSTAELSVTIDNLSVLQYFNANDLTNGVYTVKGHVNKRTDSLKINGEKVAINDDLTFTTDVKVSNGRNVVKVYAEDKDGTVVADYSYKIFYDDKVPELNLNLGNLLMREDKVYVNNADFDLNVNIKENLFGYALYINGERVAAGDYNPSTVNDGIDKTFVKNIKLKDGENIINVEAFDANNNSSSQTLNVVLDTEAPDMPEIKLSTDKVTNKPVTVTLNSNEKQLDRIEYSTDGVNFVKYTGEFAVAASTKVYARAVDYAGNVSKASEAVVNIDTTKPVVTVSGVNDGGVYYEPVTLAADVDDKNAKTELLVNGKEYNGEKLDVEGDYTVEASAVDEAGNKSDVVKKSFKLAQNCIDSLDKDIHVLKHNDIKPAGDNYLFESLEGNNVKTNITDSTKGAVILSPSAKVTLSKDLTKSFAKDGLEYMQKVYEDKDLLSALNSVGSVFELSLNNGKDITNLGDNKINISLLLGTEQLKGKDTSKLKAYIYDEAKKEWKEIGGEFDNTSSVFTFATDTLGRFTVAELKAAAGNDGADSTGNTSNNNKANSSINNSASGNHAITSGAKTGDSIIFAGAVAVVAVVAAVIAFFTRKKK